MCVCVLCVCVCVCGAFADAHGRQCVCALWATLIAVNGHGAIPLVVSGLAGVGTVDRDLVVVGS